MKHQITKEPTEELELNVEDGRYALIQRYKDPDDKDSTVTKTIIMNPKEALRLTLAISEEMLKLGHTEVNRKGH